MKRIPLSAIRNSEPRGFALVDDADYDWIIDAGPWQLAAVGYAVRNLRQENHRRMPGIVLMHRLILGLEPGDRRHSDHIDHDRLNNQRSNLRIVTQQQNNQNKPAGRGSSVFRGVFWEKGTRKWRARVELNGQRYGLGRFADEIEAARVVDAWRREHMPYAEPDPALLAADLASAQGVNVSAA